MFAIALPAFLGITFGNLLTIAFILTVFYLAYRWAMRHLGPNLAERLPEAKNDAETVQLLREVRQSMERMDQRVEMLEVLLKDVRNRLDAVETEGHGAARS